MNNPVTGGVSPTVPAGKRTPAPSPRLLLLLSVLLASLIYTVNIGDFFFHDSVRTIEHNQAIRVSGLGLDEWRTAAMSTHTGPLGRPLSMLSFAANHAMTGELDAASIKLTNVGLHALCGIFLWLFLQLVLARSPLIEIDRHRAQLVAAVVAAVWLLHPLQVSTVMYAVQRMTQLAALFAFAGLWHLFTLRTRWLEVAPTAVDFSRFALVGVVWTTLAALSKENGILLPLLAAVTELTLFRFRVAGGRSQLTGLATIGSLAAAAMLTAIIPLVASDTFQAWYAQRPFSLDERLLTQARMLWHYLGWVFIPDITAMGFNHDDIPLSQGLLQPVSTLFSILAFMALAALAWWGRARWPLLGFALLWFLAGHLLESSIIPLEMSYEHRNYLPVAGPLLLLAALPVTVAESRAGFARLGLALFVLALLPLLYLRAAAWSSELNLAESNYRYHPGSPKSAFHLASAYYDEARAQNDRDTAREYFSASRLVALQVLDRQPDYVPALAWLILLDSRSSDTGRLQEWRARLGEALDKSTLTTSDLRSVIAINQCVTAGECPDSAGEQKRFLLSLQEQHPDLLPLRLELARYWMSAGCPDCAREQAEAILARQPRSFEALEVLYLLELSAQRPGRALEVARRLMKVDGNRTLVRSLAGDADGGGG